LIIKEDELMNLKHLFTAFAGLLFVGLYSGEATALHLTSASVNPASIFALPGETVQYSGSVDASTECSSFTSYATSLSVAGEPAGALTTFTPTGSNTDDSTPYGYTLDIEVPIDAPTGTYPLGVTVDFFGTPCETGQTTVYTSLIVLAGRCPSGGNWFLTPALDPNDVFDMNGDGFICTKEIPGEGKGNSANREGGADVGHVDGHNHKDNNN
jgi:hypothetical protein